MGGTEGEIPQGHNIKYKDTDDLVAIAFIYNILEYGLVITRTYGELILNEQTKNKTTRFWYK